MVMPRGDGLATHGFFWLEIEMLSQDQIHHTLIGHYKRPRVCPPKGLPSMDLLRISKFIKPKVPCGLVKCSKANLVIYKSYMHAYKGTGRRFATSLGTKGIL